MIDDFMRWLRQQQPYDIPWSVLDYYIMKYKEEMKEKEEAARPKGPTTREIHWI